MSLRNKLLTQGGVSGLFRAFSLLCGFGTAVLLARTLGVSGLGVYASALAILTIFSLPLEFGLPALVTREVAKFYHSQSYGQVAGIMYFGAIFVLLAFIPIAFIALKVIPITPWASSIVANDLWWLILLYIVFIGLASLFNGCLAGAHFLIASQFSALILRPLVFVIVLVAALFYEAEKLNALTVLWAQTLSVAISVLVSFLILMKVFLPKLIDKKPVYQIGAWFSSAWKLGLVNAVRRIHPQLLLFILSLLTSSEAVGLFRVCQRGVSLVSFGTSLVTTIASPYVSTFYANQEWLRLNKLLSKSAQAMTVWALIFLGVLVVFGKQILFLVFGPEYVNGYTILVIFCFVEFFTAYFGMSVIMLNMTGKETVSAKIMAFGLIPSLLGTIALVPYVGAIGAALAYAVSSVLVYGYSNRAVWKLYRIETSVYAPFRKGRVKDST